MDDGGREYTGAEVGYGDVPAYKNALINLIFKIYTGPRVSLECAHFTTALSVNLKQESKASVTFIG